MLNRFEPNKIDDDSLLLVRSPAGQWTGPLRYRDVRDAYRKGEFQKETELQLMVEGNPVGEVFEIQNILFLDTNFQPSVEAILSSTSAMPVVVVCGANNSGKTLLLKQLLAVIGRTAYLIGTNRFYHADRLPQHEDTFTPDLYGQQLQQFGQAQNSDSNLLGLDQAIVSLSDADRRTLNQLCQHMLGDELIVVRSDADNECSPQKVTLGGYSLASASTGTRILVTVLSILLNKRFRVVLIDEPELGLNPGVQKKLANLIFDQDLRFNHFPHLEKIILATHSHIFLNRQDIPSNFAIKKMSDVFYVNRIDSIHQLSDVHFNLLGGDLESLFLPEYIMLVEGSTDKRFISTILRIRGMNKPVAYLEMQNSGAHHHARSVAAIVGEPISHSPYKERVFVLLDSKNSTRKTSLVTHGIPAHCLMELSKNGIEHSSVRLKIKQNQLVILWWCNGSAGIGLQGA